MQVKVSDFVPSALFDQKLEEAGIEHHNNYVLVSHVAVKVNDPNNPLTGAFFLGIQLNGNFKIIVVKPIIDGVGRIIDLTNIKSILDFSKYGSYSMLLDLSIDSNAQTLVVDYRYRYLDTACYRRNVEIYERINDDSEAFIWLRRHDLAIDSDVECSVVDHASSCINVKGDTLLVGFLHTDKDHDEEGRVMVFNTRPDNVKLIQSRNLRRENDIYLGTSIHDIEKYIIGSFTVEEIGHVFGKVF